MSKAKDDWRWNKLENCSSPFQFCLFPPENLQLTLVQVICRSIPTIVNCNQFKLCYHNNNSWHNCCCVFLSISSIHSFSFIQSFSSIHSIFFKTNFNLKYAKSKSIQKSFKCHRKITKMCKCHKNVIILHQESKYHKNMKIYNHKNPKKYDNIIGFASLSSSFRQYVAWSQGAPPLGSS